MAQRVHTILISDMSGEEIPDGEGQSVEFAVRGRTYRIDLSNAEATAFDQALAPYVQNARSAGRQRPGTSGRAPARTDKAQLDAMRRWARDNGYQVSDRGRIPVAVQDAYHATTSA